MVTERRESARFEAEHEGLSQDVALTSSPGLARCSFSGRDGGSHKSRPLVQLWWWDPQAVSVDDAKQPREKSQVHMEGC